MRRILVRYKFKILLCLVFLLGIFILPNIKFNNVNAQSASVIIKEKIILNDNKLDGDEIIDSISSMIINKIRKSNEIIEPITINLPNSPPPPSDPFYYLDTNLENYFNLQLIHDFSNGVFGPNGYTGNGVTIAVLDASVAYNHPYFSTGYDSLQHSYIITSELGTAETPSVIEGDYQEHATACASIIKQIAPKANIISVGPRGGVSNTENSLGVFEWLLNNYDSYNIKIVSRSMSYSGYKTTPPEFGRAEQIIKYLSGNGPSPITGLYIPEGEEILFVFSSGNNYNTYTGYGISWPGSLANLPNIICVGYTDFDEYRVPANGLPSGESIHNDDDTIRMECMAPAENLYACLSDISVGPTPTSSSIATPIVAGALALALEKYGTSEIEEIESLIRGKEVNPEGDFYSINKPAPEFTDEETGEIDFDLLKKYYGFGIINIAGILELKDSDSDGLTDYFEYVICDTETHYSHPLNPWSADTDEDLMPDEWEVLNHLCPLLDDSTLDPDSDNLMNINEFEAGTNPNDWDTDDDLLGDATELIGVYVSDTNDPNFYLYTWCYGIVVPPNNIVLFTQTNPLDDDPDSDNLTDKQECVGHQIIVTITRANDIVNEINTIYKTNPNYFDSDYDGLTDNEEITGVTIWTYEDGVIYQLFGIQTIPVIADMDGDGLLDGEEVNGIVDPNDPDNRIYSDPRKYDTDNDGLPDGWEINNNLDPLANDATLDSDNDDLTNLEEYNCGTNPHNADSDEDGMEDGWEISYYLNPLVNDALTDIDGDNLNNLDEFIHNCDPTDADCDDDYLLDGDEILTYGTDPWDSDSDNDGLSDYSEIFCCYTDPLDDNSDDDGWNDYYEVITSGTDPNLADTDNDGILDHLEQNYNTNPLIPDCDYDGLLDGEEVNTYLTDPTKDDSDFDGLEDLEEVTLGSDGYYTDPNDSDSDNDGLYDAQEATYGSNPNYSDSDSDGLNDGDEVNTHSTDPTDSDSDNDGLSDLEEVTSGSDGYITNPNNFDSDNDGLDDLEEVAFGSDGYKTNPIDPDSDDDGLNDGQEDTYNTNPNDVDSDNDGLNDYYEIYSSNTNPNDSDDDNDGWNDGFEVYISGTNPKKADTDSDGLTDKNEYNYWKYTRGRTTSQAYAYCKDSDVDNDNMKDGTELAVGCDPLDNDTDNDGLYDGSEDLYYDTDPTDYDSDNDGYSDGEEVAAGSDPNDPNDTPSGGGFGW